MTRWMAWRAPGQRATVQHGGREVHGGRTQDTYTPGDDDEHG